MRYLIAVLAAAVLLPSIANAEDKTDWNVKSEKAIAALEEVLKTDAASGDSDEATKIRDAIRALKAMSGSNPQSLLKDGVYLAAEFDSIWTHEYHVDGDNIRLVQVIHDKGSKHKVGWPGKINVIGPNTLEIIWAHSNGEKTRDVWAIADTRIFLQHMPLGADASKPAPHFLVSDVKK